MDQGKTLQPLIENPVAGVPKLPPLAFRMATAGDVEAIVSLVRENHELLGLIKAAPFDPVFMAQLVANTINQGFVGVVVDGDSVAGVLLAPVLPVWFNPASKYLAELLFWVTPIARHRRGATLLLDAMEQWAKEHGVAMISVGSDGLHMSKIMSKLFLARGYQRSAIMFERRVA